MAGYESLRWLLIYDFLCEFTFIFRIRRKLQSRSASNFTLLTLHISCSIYINPIWDDHTRTPRPDGNRTAEKRAFAAHDRTRWGFNTDWVDWQAAAARRRCRRERCGWMNVIGVRRKFCEWKADNDDVFLHCATLWWCECFTLALHFDFYVRQFARIVWTKWPQILVFNWISENVAIFLCFYLKDVFCVSNFHRRDGEFEV